MNRQRPASCVQRALSLAAALVIFLVDPRLARAERLLGVSWPYPPANGVTFRIDTATGTGTSIGPSGINFLNSLSRDQSGTYWSAGMPSSDLRNHLVRINPLTGAGTLGPLLNFGSFDTSISAMAVSSTNVLYAIALNDYLFTVDRNTGTGSLIGKVGIAGSPIGVNAMAFAADGTLYGWGVERYGLIRINPSTPAFTDVNSSAGPGAHVQAMTFGTDGTLYGARDALYRINISTGFTTAIGSGGFADVRGIAIVPEPSSVALAAVALCVVVLFVRPRLR